MDNLEFNFCAAMHNLGLVSEARKLINNFINDGEGFIYAINPDGTYLKLQKGVNLFAVDGLGIIEEEEEGDIT